MSQARQTQQHQAPHDQLDLQSGFPKYEVSVVFYFSTSLTSITKSGAATRSYSYDANGAVTADGKRVYQWTSFNKVEKITQASAPVVNSFGGAGLWAAGSSVTDFDYDASNNRVRQILTRNGLGMNSASTQRVTTYVGSYEREAHYNSSSVLWQVRHRHMVGGFLQIKRTETSGQSGVTEVLSYFLKDHLGSTTAVLDENGTVVERPSFDAWGKTRHATTWADADASTEWLSSAHTNRGYTGHEQLDESGLVHMNGRVYDPEVGRFLSPDPYVQDPEHSQNFNRYAYVLNNPLSYTDPSGHFFTAVFAAVIKAVITAVTVAVQAIVTVGKWVYSAVKAFLGTGLGKFLFGAPSGVGNAILKGATWGGINGAVSGARGSDLLRGILVGGITGGITMGLINDVPNYLVRVAGHGVVGGASNVAMGGKFKDGFISAAAGHAFPSFQLGDSPFARTVSAGIIGGTASVLGGGKFANGAYTATFMHLMAEGTRNQDIINRDRVQAKWFYPDGDPSLAQGVDGHGILGNGSDKFYQDWADRTRNAVFHIYSEGPPGGILQDVGEVVIERLAGGIGSKVTNKFLEGFAKLPNAARLSIDTHSQGVSPVVAAMFKRPELFRGTHLVARSSSVYAHRLKIAALYTGSTYEWKMPTVDVANIYSSINPYRIIRSAIQPGSAVKNHTANSTELHRRLTRY